MAEPGFTLPPELETGPITDNAIAVNPAKAALGAIALEAMPLQTMALMASVPSARPTMEPAPPIAAGPPVAAPLPVSQPVEAPLPSAAPVSVTAKATRRGGGGGAAPGAPGVADLSGDIARAGEQGLRGIEKTQDAKAQASADMGRAYEDLSVAQRADAQELADTQKDVRARQAELDAQDAANLKRARDYTIPEFWKGREGARVGSILAIIGGGIAQGITGGPNGALQIVNKNVDDYFHREKDKIDNLYKYAEQTGRLNNQTRMRYAQELTDLQAQHLAVQQSVLSRIEAVKAKNQGNVDAAAYDTLAANLQQQIIDGKERERQNRSQIQATFAGQQETARHNRATEGIARAELGIKQQKAAGTEDKTAVFDDQGRLIGHVTGGRGGAQAFSARDADYTRAEHALAALYQDIQQNGERVFSPDAIKRRNSLHKAAVGGVATVSPLGKTIEALHNEEAQIGQSGALGFNLGAVAGANPEALARKIGEIRDQRERYRAQSLIGYGAAREGGAAQPAQAGQQQIPIGATSTSQGRPIVMTAQGWQLAQ